jgi:hypothetical protein
MGKQRVKPNYRRRVLRLPDLDHCKLAVLNSLGSPASRRVYQAQANRPFDHEARLKDLLARQAQLNAALDLDKNETQIAPPADDQIEPVIGALQGPAIPPRVQRTSAPHISP